MGEVIGQILPMAVAAGLSPIPIIAVIVMLTTAQARTNGPAFLVGWLIGLGGIGIVVLGVASRAGANSGSQPATWVILAEGALGVLLVIAAGRQFQGRPRSGEESPMPAWMAAVDTFSPGKAIGAGILMSAVNPKNLLLSVAAAATIVHSGLAIQQQVVAYLVFVVIATVGVATPIVIYFALGDRAPATLDRMKHWMAQNNAVIMTVLCLIIGVKLLGQAIGDLTG